MQADFFQHKLRKIRMEASVHNSEKEQLIDLGRALRGLIRANAQNTGRTHRHLSRSIGKDPNYITSYLSKDPDVWTIPKHPTYAVLLVELGVTKVDATARDLDEMVYALSKAAAE
ncbi:MAG: hypothetical protein AAF230_00030 [Pseudomonadota bacterium]